ncbi:serine/threonine-protein kinase [Myxococcus sp. CA040A]|uniref:serine/threonine-protein kinase n=1 Tax=Myxococcus sp. CA040A TaxID=2741738 RepID=UPI00157AD65A|nr:serine/threonine-protein kinase [Myxococcus sp. CA040A]NTX06772.1 protein kinase [Myxococcus sp. CA040A]
MALQPGDRFGRYELVSWLGRGGMAETWRARWMGDAGVTKSVLIKKVLPEFVADDAFVSMFINEARISATLSHGCIAQVFDFGRVEGQYYLAMELVDGQPLHHVLKRALKTGLSRMPIPLATYITLEMCRGLHYAHTRTDDKGKPLGIVHRDISPDNVLISYEGQVKIVDFGIAKAQLARNFMTEPGVVKGKYLYFSPEQARGYEVDARSDVWSTGLVLYEMLCGQPPVSGTPAAVMMRMAHGEFPSPREVRGDLPVELDELVMRALSVDLSARYESANAFADALAAFLYSHAPRFSTMNLAYLVRVLFRGDMAVEGRELSVPASFIDELTLWRASGAPPEVPPKKERGKKTASRAETEMDLDLRSNQQRTTRRLLPAMGVGSTHATEETPETHVPEVPAPSSGGLWGWGLMLGIAAVLVVGTVAFPEYYIAARSTVMPTPDPVAPHRPPEGYPPGATRADVLHARVLLDRGDFPTASSLAEKCLAVAPNHPDCLWIAGASMARLKQLPEAEMHFKRLITAHRDHPLAETALTLLEEMKAERNIEQGRSGTTSAVPKKCQGVDPNALDCLMATAERFEQLEEFDKAVQAYLSVAILYAGHPSASLARNQAVRINHYSRSQKTPPSTKSNAAAGLSHDNPDRLIARARQFLKEQDYGAALQSAEQCHVLARRNPDCFLLMGIANARLNNLEEGAGHYRRFLGLAPLDHPARPGVENLLKQYDSSK